MGNSKSYQQKKVTIPAAPGEWIQMGNTGYCEIVKNSITGVVAEQYHIPLDHRLSPEENEEIYEERRVQNDNLVTVYQVEKENNQYLCQGKDFIIVRVERIPYRLSQMNNLSFAQALYVLREAALGYRAITEFYGPVSITDQMIGFTPNHRVKVWLNEQFAHNLPNQNSQIFFRQPAHIQQRLPNTVSQLFSVIEQHCENGQFPEHFAKAYRQYPIQTFSQALQFIEDYAKKQGLSLRTSVASSSSVSIKTESSHQEKLISLKGYTPHPTTPVAQKRQPPRVSKQLTETKKYYIIPQSKIDKRLITSAEMAKESKMQVKPSSHYIPSVVNNNIVAPVRIITKPESQPLSFKVVSRESPLTFTPIAASKVSKLSHKPAPEIKTNSPNTLMSTVASIKNSPTQSIKQSVETHEEPKSYQTVSATTFKDLNRYWSPGKLLSRDTQLPQRRVGEIQLKNEIQGKYQKLYTEAKSSSASNNVKVENAPKTITFSYSKTPKPALKT